MYEPLNFHFRQPIEDTSHEHMELEGRLLMACDRLFPLTNTSYLFHNIVASFECRALLLPGQYPEGHK